MPLPFIIVLGCDLESKDLKTRISWIIPRFKTDNSGWSPIIRPTQCVSHGNSYSTVTILKQNKGNTFIPVTSFCKDLISSLWFDQLARCILLYPAREHPLMVSGCLQTHDKIPLSALESNLDCARRSTAFIEDCYIKQRVTGKQHIQAYFTPQSVKDVSCSILCTVVMANEGSNIWSDGVPGMAGYGQWVRLLCKNLLICLLLLGRSRTNLQYDS